MKSYPAINIRSNALDLIYAVLDDFGPTAIEEREDGLRAFFSSPDARNAALGALSPQFAAAAIDVPDDDWARRSQENLQPITVGRITIAPHAELPSTTSGAAGPQTPTGSLITIVIEPSMGFGTGHHATTRLCLSALQDLNLSGKTVLDVGTGSGVLAIAADRLGAARAIGIDCDPDAIQSARENLALNGECANVLFDVADLAAAPLPLADVVTANLTGALLQRSAAALLDATKAGGTLILSGLMREEREAVCHAFAPAEIAWERHEDEWVGLAVKKR